MAEGIDPDAVIGVDSVKRAAYQENYVSHYQNIMWIAETICNHRVTKLVHSYRNVILDSGDQINNAIYERAGCPLPALATGGSVANTAFSLLELWGFETIILIGQDLALTGNRRYSDKDIDAEKEAIEKGYSLIEIEAYDGGTVKTREDYRTYLKWFESAIAITDAKRVINATEGGAMIHGAVNMTLKDALNKYATKEYDVRALIDAVPRTLNEEQKDELEVFIRNFPKRVEFFIRMFKEGRDLTQRGMTLLNRGNFDEKELQKLKKRLGEIDDSVSNELEFVLICNRASDVDRRIARELTVSDGEDDSPVDVLNSMHELYCGFLEAMEDIKWAVGNLEWLMDEEGRR